MPYSINEANEMVKKILYYIRSYSHRRVFESLRPIDGIDQIVLGPPEKIIDGIPEGYRSFGIQNIKIHNSIEEAQKIVNKIKPNVFVQADFPNRVNVPKNCKRVFMAHGMIGNHVKSLFKAGSMQVWKDFDLYCGASKRFEDWIWHITGKKHKVIINAMPQLDLLYDPDYYMKTKNRILKYTRLQNPSAIILFCGFCCKDRKDFNAHNQDYFDALIELDRIAKKHNWLVFVKPRQTFKKVMKFISMTGWAKKYKTPYTQINSSKNLHFIPSDANIYRYFFADMIIANGCSTIEIESCVAKKPLIMVRTKSGPNYDPFETVMNGAAKGIKNINNLEQIIVNLLSNNDLSDNQDRLINKIGLLADGLAYKRAQDGIIAL